MVFSEEDKVLIKVLCQKRVMEPSNSPGLNPVTGGLSCVERTGAAGVSHTHSRRQSPQDTSG